MELVKDWILGFLKRYKAILAPSDWPTGENPDELRFYLGAWVTALGRQFPKVAEAEADAALERLVLDPPRFRSEHIPAFIQAIHELRRQAQTTAMLTAGPSQAECTARDQSRDCPECMGSGWARRRVKWHSAPRPFLLDLFCRCPLGRWRIMLDVARHRSFDDLQARPDLWHPDRDHPTWSSRPLPPEVDVDAGDEARGWRYLGLDEPAPEPTTPAAAMAGGMFPTGGRR